VSSTNRSTSVIYPPMLGWVQTISMSYSSPRDSLFPAAKKCTCQKYLKKTGSLTAWSIVCVCVCTCGLARVFIRCLYKSSVALFFPSSSLSPFFSTSLPHTACGIPPCSHPPSSIFLSLSLMHSPCRCSTCSSQVCIDRSVIEARPARAVSQWLRLLRPLVMTCTLSLRTMGFLMQQLKIVSSSKINLCYLEALFSSAIDC